MFEKAFWDRQRSESVNCLVPEEVIGHVSFCVGGECVDLSQIPLLEKGTVLSDTRGEGAFQ